MTRRQNDLGPDGVLDTICGGYREVSGIDVPFKNVFELCFLLFGRAEIFAQIEIVVTERTVGFLDCSVYDQPSNWP